MNLWTNIIQKIENEPWDDYLISADRWMRSACFVVIVLACLYFGGHILWWVVR